MLDQVFNSALRTCPSPMTSNNSTRVAYSRSLTCSALARLFSSRISCCVSRTHFLIAAISRSSCLWSSQRCRRCARACSFFHWNQVFTWLSRCATSVLEISLISLSMGAICTLTLVDRSQAIWYTALTSRSVNRTFGTMNENIFPKKNKIRE